MAKIDLDELYKGKWWLRPTIEWGNIGADVVKRPVEVQALNNIALETKYLHNLTKWEIEITPIELEILKLDYLVSREDLDYRKYNNIYRKDTHILKISKLSNYSENFIRRNLKNITRKLFLLELLGYENLTYLELRKQFNSNNKYTKRIDGRKRKMITNRKMGKYKKYHNT